MKLCEIHNALKRTLFSVNKGLLVLILVLFDFFTTSLKFSFVDI